MKKIIIALVIISLLVSAVVVYVNATVLPTKIKALIVKTLQERTGKSVSLDSLRFNIFKGFVLRNLTIYDGTRTFVSLEECDCSFLFWPFFKKQIIIPTIKLKRPVIYLARRPNGSFNIADFLQPPKASQGAVQSAFDILLYKATISNGRINFEDAAVVPAFSKTIEDVNVAVTMTLPKGIQFRFMAQVSGDQKMKVNGSGAYTLKTKELVSHITVSGLQPKDFAAYYTASGLVVSGGTVDAVADIRWGNNTISLDTRDRLKEISVTKDAIHYFADASVTAQAAMDLSTKDLLYAGTITVDRGDISGLESVGTVSAVNGTLRFDNKGFYTDRARAVMREIPFEIRGNLTDFADPVIDAQFQTNTSLQTLQSAVRDIFNITIPAHCQGKAHLFFAAQANISLNAPVQFQGYMDVMDGALAIEQLPAPLRQMNGRFDFTGNQVTWKNMAFSYGENAYVTNGTVTNFEAPGIQCDVSSSHLSAHATISINGKAVKISSCAATYYNSTFSLAGNALFYQEGKPSVEMAGAFLADLQDLAKPLQDKEFFAQTKPEGTVHGKFSIKGDVTNFALCDVQAQITSDKFGMYGLKGNDFFLTYVQSEGVGTIPIMRVSLYDGSIDGSAKLELAQKSFPYSLSLNVQDVRIEKLKLDTPARDKDISGIVRAQVNMAGTGTDLASVSADGKAFINEGRLWELNLFKGLGSLIFTKDFTRIVFHEGVCSFVVHNKTLTTDDLILRGNIADILGKVRVDFDGGLGGELQVSILDQMVPLSGTFRDVTTAIVGQSGRFGTILLSGSIKEPKFKFKTAVGVTTFIRGLTDALFRGNPAE